MKIVSVNIINLERRIDLAAEQHETWTRLGFDTSEILFHKAMDGMEYDSKAEIVDAAAADGFEFFSRYHELAEDHWMGIGELACMWSISRLLRFIERQPETGAYLYVLADRYSKKDRNTLETIFSELPDFKFLQFRGYVPLPHHTVWWEGRDKRQPPKFVEPSQQIPPKSIEYGGLKIGDGVLAMTPAGARWMQEACDLHLPGVPYEVALFQLLNTTEKGVYSTFDEFDEICEQNDYYGNYDRHAWEGQYPFGTPLGESDIGKVNKIKDTGTYRDE